jgi:2-dehydro-3-deoxyphosphogluconate aldolase / (4S)-4-hydroxy-2-oxoglutarate aldolase
MSKKPIDTTPKKIYKQTLELIEKERIFFLLTGGSTGSLFEASNLIRESGFNLIGVDFQTPCAKDLLKSHKRQGQKNLGVFSISTKKESRIAIQAGATFIFSAQVEKGIIRNCKERTVFHASGAFTPTEIFNAYDLGANAISIFPCKKKGELNWLAFLKRTFPRIKFIPTDMMSPYEAAEYLMAGAYAVAPILDLETVKELKELVREFSSIK